MLETLDYTILHPFWHYTDLLIFRFVSPLCLRSTLRLITAYICFTGIVDLLRETLAIRQNMFDVIIQLYF